MNVTYTELFVIASVLGLKELNKCIPTQWVYLLKVSINRRATSWLMKTPQKIDYVKNSNIYPA